MTQRYADRWTIWERNKTFRWNWFRSFWGKVDERTLRSLRNCWQNAQNRAHNMQKYINAESSASKPKNCLISPYKIFAPSDTAVLKELRWVLDGLSKLPLVFKKDASLQRSNHIPWSRPYFSFRRNESTFPLHQGWQIWAVARRYRKRIQDTSCAND